MFIGGCACCGKKDCPCVQGNLPSEVLLNLDFRTAVYALTNSGFSGGWRCETVSQQITVISAATSVVEQNSFVCRKWSFQSSSLSCDLQLAMARPAVTRGVWYEDVQYGVYSANCVFAINVYPTMAKYAYPVTVVGQITSNTSDNPLASIVGVNGQLTSLVCEPKWWESSPVTVIRANVGTWSIEDIS